MNKRIFGGENYKPWNRIDLPEQELRRLYLKSFLTTRQIAGVFGVGKYCVLQNMKRYDIKPLEPWKRIGWPTKRQKQITYGTVLGDASILQPDSSRYSLLSFGHADSQKKYIDWKVKELRKFFRAELRYRKDADSWHISSIVNPFFKQLREEVYDETGRKIIKREFLEKIDRLSLAVWLMDDGTKHSKNSIHLCTHSFTKEENEIIAKWFEDKFRITPRVSPRRVKKTGKVYWFLRFKQKPAQILSKIVREYIIPSMMYKLLG